MIIQVLSVVDEMGNSVVELVIERNLTLRMNPIVARNIAGCLVAASARNQTPGTHEIMFDNIPSRHIAVEDKPT